MTAVADRFAPVLGPRRGFMSSDELAAPRSTAAGRARLAAILAAGENACFAALAANASRPEAPLTRRLAASVAADAVRAVSEQLADESRVLAFASGARTRDADNLLMEGHWKTGWTLHIHPHGHLNLLPRRSMHKTVCGLDLQTRMMNVPRRGSWADPGCDIRHRDVTRCADCAAEAGRFSECQETVRYPPLPAPEMDRLHRRFTEQVAVSALDLARAGALTRASLADTASGVHTAMFVDALADLCFRRRYRVLNKLIEYGSQLELSAKLAREHNYDGPLAELLDAADWRQLTIELAASRPEPDDRGDGDTDSQLMAFGALRVHAGRVRQMLNLRAGERGASR